LAAGDLPKLNLCGSSQFVENHLKKKIFKKIPKGLFLVNTSCPLGRVGVWWDTCLGWEELRLRLLDCVKEQIIKSDTLQTINKIN
jgi:hypothetical protein